MVSENIVQMELLALEVIGALFEPVYCFFFNFTHDFQKWQTAYLVVISRSDKTS